MVRKKKVCSFAIDFENCDWLEDQCKKEDLSQSQVINKAIKKMRQSGILW